MGSGNFLSSFKSKYIIAVCLVVFAVVMRLVPHPANFAPITALAIFGAYKLPGKTGLLLPLSAMIVSDMFLGFHQMIFWTWGSFVLIALISRFFVGKGYSVDKLLYSSMAGSVTFFLVTNFGVWAQGWLYPRTFDGLMSSYYNALPFFRGTIAGDLFYTFGIFALYHLSVKSINLVSNRSTLAQQA